MRFALLVPQLPHVDDARAHYNQMLTLEAPPAAPARIAAAFWTALKKLAR